MLDFELAIRAASGNRGEHLKEIRTIDATIQMLQWAANIVGQEVKMPGRLRCETTNLQLFIEKDRADTRADQQVVNVAVELGELFDFLFVLAVHGAQLFID